MNFLVFYDSLFTVRYQRGHTRNPVARRMRFGAATIGHPDGAPGGHGSEAETQPVQNGGSGCMSVVRCPLFMKRSLLGACVPPPAASVPLPLCALHAKLTGSDEFSCFLWQPLKSKALKSRSCRHDLSVLPGCEGRSRAESVLFFRYFGWGYRYGNVNNRGESP